jgi:hypothetical protein
MDSLDLPLEHLNLAAEGQHLGPSSAWSRRIVVTTSTSSLMTE